MGVGVCVEGLGKEKLESDSVGLRGRKRSEIFHLIFKTMGQKATSYRQLPF